LDDYNVPGRAILNPTIAAGDFQVDKDGAGLTNLTTLPTVEPAGSKLVKITLSATEMNADVVTVVCSDQTEPPQWCDLIFSIPTTS
jgi:hypothetical protein